MCNRELHQVIMALPVVLVEHSPAPRLRVRPADNVGQTRLLDTLPPRDVIARFEWGAYL